MSQSCCSSLDSLSCVVAGFLLLKRPISKERSSLACVALDILHDLLDETHPVGEGFSCLEPGTIGTEELCRIVWLGEIVDKVLLRTPNWEKSVGPSKGNVWLVHQPQLGSSEKQLWYVFYRTRVVQVPFLYQILIFACHLLGIRI